MATSGTITYNLTRDQLITQALQDIGVLRDGASPSTAQINYCSTALNLIVKDLEDMNILVWGVTEATVFLTSGVNKYSLANTISNSCGDNTVKTTLSATSSSSTLVCSTVNNMNSGDNIGVVLDNGNLFWTTINGAPNTTSLTVTLTTPLTSQASSGNVVYVYTNTSTKPLRILNARRQDSNLVETNLKIISRNEFDAIPLKLPTQGVVNQVFYTPGEGTGYLYVFLTPSDSTQSINIAYARTIQDFSSSSDNADIPQYMLNTFILLLGRRIASHYGKDLTKLMPDYIVQCNDALMRARMWDVEAGSTYITPADDDE